MDPWQTLNAELDAWAASDKVADLWWRDDDAIAAGARLDRLISITETTGLLLAVIPSHAEDGLAKSVSDASHVKVAQHGYAHVNHAGRGLGLGAWELGLHRGEQAVLDDLDCGRELLAKLLVDDFIPVIVPPWNHMDPALYSSVAARGYLGVSGFGPRQADTPSGTGRSDFVIVNAHCDLIRWKTGAVFKGERKTINQLVEHLHNRRSGAVDVNEPTGYLTHHLDLDDDGWAFSEKLVRHINDHPAARWQDDVAALFGDNL